MMKISTILAIAIALMLLLSNTYAASTPSSDSGSDSDSAGDTVTTGTKSSGSTTTGTKSSTASATVGGATTSASAASGSTTTSSSSTTTGSSSGIINNTTGGGSYGRLCSSGVWRPAPGMPWLWQIGTVPSNAVIAASNAQAIDLDMWGTSAATIAYVHSLGKAMICYIDTQYEPGRPDSASFTAAVKGSPIEGWPGQLWVDIRSPIVRNIMTARAKIAQAKGCDAIEWDDVDGYANPNGFNLQAADQLSFNKFLSSLTHSLGMSVGLKNDVDQISSLVNYYDWALNEQCYQYSECDDYQLFVKQGKAVFGTEYQGSAATFCPIQNKAGYSWLLSDLNLDGKGTTQCCTYNTPACAKGTYQCVTPVSAATSEELPSSASSLAPSAIYVVGVAAASFFLASLF